MKCVGLWRIVEEEVEDKEKEEEEEERGETK